ESSRPQSKLRSVCILGPNARSLLLALRTLTQGFSNWQKIDFGFFQERLDFQYLTTLPLQNLLTDLSHLPPQTLVFYTTVFRDGAGETLVPREVVKRVSAAANAPTYGFFEQYVGQGIIGGQINSLAAHGVEAAKLALEVLAGTAASRPQVAEIPTNKLVFDWR